MGLFVTSKSTKNEVADSPKILLKERLKKIEISGRSRMTDPAQFYEDLRQKLESHFYEFRKTLIIDFKFDYLNSGSSKWLYYILRSLQNLTKNEGLIEINWYYEEDDEVILEAGEVLESLLKIPFHIKQY
jgi:hypothetical protein